MGMPRVTGHVKQTIRPDLGLVINDQWITQAQNSHFFTNLFHHSLHASTHRTSWAPARGEQGGQAPTLEKNQGGHGPPWKF